MHASCRCWTLPNPSLYACWSCTAKGSVPAVCHLLKLCLYRKHRLSVTFCTIKVCFHMEQLHTVLIRSFSTLLPVQVPWGRLSSTPQPL